MSMLVVLDRIHETFGHQTDLWDKLTSCDCPINFYILDFGRFDLSDDLYNKMNSRGKPLTSFEIVKAKIHKLIRKINIDKANKIAIKFDTTWMQFIWEAKGKKDAEVEVATSIDNLVKDFREKIDAKGKAEAKAEAVKLKEKEEKAKIEKGLNINLKDKLFKLDNILSGSSFPIPDRRSLMELNNDQITVLEIFKELKRLIGTSKKLEKATPEMIFKSFFEAFSNKGAEINFKDFNESKDE
jgi:hypothetical protein